MKPDFIGLGAQKCASTWIYRVLEEHPQVGIIKGQLDKYSMFFDCFYNRGFEWYENHFTDCNESDVNGEYGTSYIHSFEAPERIYDYNPLIKLIACIRNPVDRVISNHKHLIRNGQISGGNIILENGVKNNPMYIQQSLYYDNLVRWFNLFPREQILVLVFEELIENPEKFKNRIYSFLGVDEKYMPSVLGKQVNESKIVKTSSFQSVISKISSIARYMKMGWLVSLSKSIGIKEILVKNDGPKKEIIDVSVSDEARKNLWKIFEDDVRNLSELLEIDFSFWK